MQEIELLKSELRMQYEEKEDMDRQLHLVRKDKEDLIQNVRDMKSLLADSPRSQEDVPEKHVALDKGKLDTEVKYNVPASTARVRPAVVIRLY